MRTPLSDVLLLTLIFVTFRVTGAPVPLMETTVCPEMNCEATNPEPVIPTGTLAPTVPDAGDIELTVTGDVSSVTVKVRKLLQAPELHIDNEYPPAPAVELMLRVAVNDVLVLTLRLLTPMAELAFVPFT